MATTVTKGTNRPAAAARSNKHAQRTSLPERVRSGETTLTEAQAELMAMEPKGAAKAERLLAEVSGAGWSGSIVHPVEVPGRTVLSLVRGAEVITVAWNSGVFSCDESAYVVGDRTTRPRNVSQARQIALRAPEAAAAELSKVASNRAWRRKVAEPKAPRPLPFDPETATETEPWERLRGRTVSLVEPVFTEPGERQLGTDPTYFKVTEVNGERVIHFTSNSGFRACRVVAIKRVTR